MCSTLLHDHARHLAPIREQHVEAAHERLLIALGCAQIVEHGALLGRGAPAVRGLALDVEEARMAMPRIARLGAPAQRMGVDLAELAAPLTNGCVGDADTASSATFLDIAVAEREVER